MSSYRMPRRRRVQLPPRGAKPSAASRALHSNPELLMRTLRLAAALALVSSRATAQHSSIHEPGDAPITIHAAAMIDGRGHEQRDVLVTVRRGKIERVDVGSHPSAVTYELGQATLLPGLIDAHVHPGWYINRDGALHNNRDADTPVEQALSRAGNLYATLMAGFTTIQSVGGMGLACATWAVAIPVTHSHVADKSTTAISRRIRCAG